MNIYYSESIFGEAFAKNKFQGQKAKAENKIQAIAENKIGFEENQSSQVLSGCFQGIHRFLKNAIWKAKQAWARAENQIKAPKNTVWKWNWLRAKP